MKHTIIFFFISVFCSYNLSGQEIVKAKSNLSQSIENRDIVALIDRYTADFPNNTQLSIVLVDEDTSQFIGIIRLNDTLQITNNKEAIFEIGSITKVFTSVLFSKQVQKKNLALDDKMLSLFPFATNNGTDEGKEITLKMLANHTSGLSKIPQNMFSQMLANQQNPYKNYTIELLEDYYKNWMVIENKPNTVNSYSNLGAGTLGYLLTLNAKKTYEELLQRDVFMPLRMTSSTTLRSIIDETRLVKGLNPDGSVTSNWDFTDALVGAGGIKSNAVDMEKFIRKNFEDDEVYNLPQRPTFSVDQYLEVGLGWHISTREDGKLHWHNGATGGYRSCLVINKESKKAVLVLSNVSAFGNNSANIDNLSFELIQKL